MAPGRPSRAGAKAFVSGDGTEIEAELLDGGTRLPVTLSLRHHMTMFAFVGSGGKVVEKEATITLDRGTEYMKLYFGLSGLSLIQLRFEQID